MGDAIEPAEKRAEALSLIARVQAQTHHFAEALSTTVIIEPAEKRAKALIGIASMQTQAGLQAGQILAEAASTAAAIDNHRTRAELLCRIAVAQAQAGSDSRPTLAKALSAAKGIKYTWWLHSLLPLLDIAEVLLSRKIQLSCWDQEPSASVQSRVEVLCEIAVAQAKAGLDAVPIFAKAFSATKSIKDSLWRIIFLSLLSKMGGLFELTVLDWSCERFNIAENRVKLLSRIAVAHTQAGLDPERTFDRALFTARAISDEGCRAEVLSVIADAQVRAGLDAGPIFAEAASVAKAIDHDELRDRTLSTIAPIMTQANSFAVATSAAKAITVARGRDTALRAIVSAQAKGGHFAEAVSTSTTIGYPEERAEALIEIAVLQTQAGLNAGPVLAEAASTAAAIAYRRTRAKVLSAIAVAQAQAGLNTGPIFSEAVSASGAIEDSKDRADVLRAIAIAQAQASDVTDSLSTVDMVSANQEDGLNGIGSAMAKLTDQSKARAALRAYLPRAARYVDSAWHSCGVVAKLYPDKSTELANFLIAFSRKSAS